MLSYQSSTYDSIMMSCVYMQHILCVCIIYIIFQTLLYILALFYVSFASLYIVVFTHVVDVRKGIRSKNAAPILLLTPLERECYEGEVQPYRKTDYKPIICIYTSLHTLQTNASCIPFIYCMILWYIIIYMSHSHM